MSENVRDDIPPADEFGLSAVRELLRLISETDVTEIQIERGDVRLHIKRGQTSHPAPLMVTPSLATTLGSMAPPQPAAAPFHPTPLIPPPHPPVPHSAPAAEVLPTGHVITAPMVGTFYAASSPKDPPFVREGDEVRQGDVVGIVEAMKIMNEIESEFSGKVVRVLVQAGQPVEYGQPLMIIE